MWPDHLAEVASVALLLREVLRSVLRHHCVQPTLKEGAHVVLSEAGAPVGIVWKSEWEICLSYPLHPFSDLLIVV